MKSFVARLFKLLAYSITCVLMLGASGCRKTSKAAAQKAKTSHKKDDKLVKQKNRVKTKSISQMTYEELKEEKAYLAQQESREGIRKCLEKMVLVCTDINELKELTLELADLLFDTGSLTQAAELYTQFITSYPGDLHIEYAHYKAILSNFYLMLSPDRDQERTKQALSLSKSFLDREKIYVTYASEVKNIQRQCYTNLATSECGVFMFYINKGNVVAAQKRLDYIKDKLAQEFESLKPLAIELECVLAQHQNKTDVLEKKEAELLLTFPTHKLTYHQLKDTQKKQFAAKF